MEKRLGKINISAAGGTAGKNSKTYKLSIPSSWANIMGICPECRDVEMTFDAGQIMIRPVQTMTSFAFKTVMAGHDVRTLLFRDQHTVNTKIYADYTDHEVCIENYTTDNLKTAFGPNLIPTWDDYLGFLEERCIPRERAGLREYLEALGLEEYDPLEIIKITRGVMAEDDLWIEVL